MVGKMLKKIKYLFKRCIAHILSSPLFKIKKNKIVFSSYAGKGYGCNPKYIAEQLIKEKVNCDMVWLVNDLSYEMPPEIRKVRYGSIKSYYELATAKIWIDNVRLYKGVNKKKNQFYIQTWHAPLGFKKVEREVENKLSAGYVKSAKNDGKISDLIVVNNKYMQTLVRKYFWYDGKVLNIGIPRNDILKNPSKQIYNKIYKKFNIDKSKGIILYAPTFRNSERLDIYDFDYEKICEQMSIKFKKDFIMLLRLHPNIQKHCKKLKYSEKVLNASEYEDMQELVAVSDIAITDFSSVMFDCSMVGKIVFLLAKDKSEYLEKDRDFEFDLKDLPFSFAESENELFINIKQFDREKYKKDCKRFYKKIGLNDTDKASEELVKIIKKIIE